MDLILDTSSQNLKVILNDNLSFLENQTTNTKHLEHLLPQIDNLLNEKNIELKDIKNFCVVVGPGSFTGVRIGISTIKAFSYVYKKAKLIAINMLEFLKHKINQKYNDNFCIIIKSTSTKFYTLVKTKKQNFSKMLMVEEIINLLNDEKDIKVFSYLDIFNFGEFVSTKIDLQSQDYIDYVNLLKEKKLYVKENDIKPIYMALSQAEEELAKKENNKNA